MAGAAVCRRCVTCTGFRVALCLAVLLLWVWCLPVFYNILTVEDAEDYQQSSPVFKVPNIVHIIWFGENREFEFLNALAFLSANFFIQPDTIFCYGDTMPAGKWWNFVETQLSNLQFVFREPPSNIFGQPIFFIEHAADFARLEILIEKGGIYLDTDVLSLRSFDELRHHACVLDIEREGYALANGVIIAEPQSQFLRLWHAAYKSFDPTQWGQHSVVMAWRLYNQFPHLMHLENRTLIGPSWYQTEKEFLEFYDWSDNYSFHVWARYYHVPKGPDEAAVTNNTIGQVMHYLFSLLSERSNITENTAGQTLYETNNRK